MMNQPLVNYNLWVIKHLLIHGYEFNGNHGLCLKGLPRFMVVFKGKCMNMVIKEWMKMGIPFSDKPFYSFQLLIIEMWFVLK